MSQKHPQWVNRIGQWWARPASELSNSRAERVRMAGDFAVPARELSRALRAMHKALVRTEISGVRAGTSPRPGAYAQMQRLLHDPALEWLKPVSTLIVELDHLLSEVEELDAVRAGEVRGAVEDLFGPKEADAREISLEQLLRERLDVLKSRFSHRQVFRAETVAASGNTSPGRWARSRTGR